MIGELTHFLGLQIRQIDSGIFLFQSKFAKNLVKKFGLESASSVRTSMSPNVKLIVDLLGKSVDPSLYMSMIGELTHFLRLQICQQDPGIFLPQSKYAKNLVKKFGLESTSFVSTPMSPNVKLIVDLLGKSVDPSL